MTPQVVLKSLGPKMRKKEICGSELLRAGEDDDFRYENGVFPGKIKVYGKDGVSERS